MRHMHKFWTHLVVHSCTLLQAKAGGTWFWFLCTSYLYHGGINTNPEVYFVLAENRSTRGHSHKILKHRAVGRVRQTAFSIRSVNDWNALPGVLSVQPQLISSRQASTPFGSLHQTEHRYKKQELNESRSNRPLAFINPGKVKISFLPSPSKL